jgi:hypothetical protein
LQEPLTARLHPKWVGGRDGYRYSVICRGELIVDRSRDPECDSARALLAMGYTGKLTILDGKTGVPRTIINIDKAAKLAVEETAGAPRLRKYRERGGSAAPSPEAPSQVVEVA